MRPCSDYPRTLIVGACFSEQSGSGTFLGRLFSGWPVDRLATVSSDCENPDWSRCRLYYGLGGQEFRVRPPFGKLIRTPASGPLLTSGPVASRGALPSSGVSMGRRLGQGPWRLLLRMLGGDGVFYRVGPSPQLLAWVEDFRPDVIYGHFSSLNSLRLLRRIQEALRLPVVLHFMDDWPTTLYRQSLPARLVRIRYLKEFDELTRSAKVAIAICQEMASEYERRYRRPVRALPMPVEMEAYRQTARTQWTAGRSFRLRYGGRVGWAIRESLTDLARTVQQFRQDGVDLTLDIATFQTAAVPAACIGVDGVTIRVPGPLADVPRVQAEADVLVICYDFDPVSFRQARYSMPAKMADCMASGTPILIYGPAGLPVVEYARRDGWGKVVDRRDPEALRRAIRELMASAALREQLGRRAQSLASERHDAAVVSESVRALLAAAGNGEPTPLVAA